MAKFNIEVELDWVDEEAGYTRIQTVNSATSGLQPRLSVSWL